jgi:hypothetical protein
MSDKAAHGVVPLRPSRSPKIRTVLDSIFVGSNPLFIPIVWTDIKPDNDAIPFNPECAITSVDAHRPEPADFLEA